jgi:hypothetical protein
VAETKVQCGGNIFKIEMILHWNEQDQFHPALKKLKMGNQGPGKYFMQMIDLDLQGADPYSQNQQGVGHS